MKNLKIIAHGICIAGLLITASCQSSSENLKDAKDEMSVAEKNLKEANQEYIADMENYKKNVSATITANEKSIIEFKARIVNSKKEAKADYEKEINELENKNSDMKRKMDEYTLEGNEQWNSFKAEFSHDMDELGKALKALTVNNME